MGRGSGIDAFLPDSEIPLLLFLLAVIALHD